MKNVHRRRHFKTARICGLAACFIVPSLCLADFGLTDSGGYYIVDTGAGLVFRVRQSTGDITSLRYNGVEYQEPTRGSHINSGLGTNRVSAQTYGTDYVKVTVVSTDGTLTHYYVARRGFNHIYMATHFTQEPSIGLVRFIVRIPSNLLPNGPGPSDIRGNVRTVEAADIFGMADGTTRSKHYSNGRLMDWAYTGATGDNVGVFMVRSNHEGDSGGPFYRSLINQCGTDQEIYEIINYGEAQTEPFRFNVLNGPYVLVFTDGSQPDPNIDTSWMADLELIGWVPDSDRGVVSGTASGIPAGFQGVVRFANGNAQYWATISDQDGSYATPLMKPGSYNVTLYKGELAVATDSVNALGGQTTALDIASSETAPAYIFKIGEWDGAPWGMLNAELITWMHPSDVRMNPWGPVSFVVGYDADSSFPCAQWRAVNDPITLYFYLTADQLGAHRLRVGITTAYAGGRPRAMVNAWTSSIPPPSSQPNSRTLTVGTYRGNNWLYTYDIPATAFVEGWNTLQLSVVSGSSGTGFLSPGYGYDAIELDY